MDIRIDGIHEQALLRLAQLNNEKTATGMVRTLIRDAAREADAWIEQGKGGEREQPITQSA